MNDIVDSGEQPVDVPSDAPADAPAEAPAAPVDSGAPSILNPAEGDTSAPAPAEPQGWADPEGWREHIAGEDKNKLNTLSRYSDISKLGEAFFEQKSMIGKGIKTVPDENAPEAEWNDFREAAGIPTSVEEYSVFKEESITEADRPFVDAMANVAHQYNVPDEAVAALGKAMKDAQHEIMQAQYQQDQYDSQQGLEAVKNMWGADAATNQHLLQTFFGDWNETLFEGQAEDGSDAVSVGHYLMAARGPDGRPIFNNPAVVNKFVEVAREVMPHVAAVPNSSNPGQSIDAEIKEIEKVFMEDESRYYKENLGDRLQELYEAQASLSR